MKDIFRWAGLGRFFGDSSATSTGTATLGRGLGTCCSSVESFSNRRACKRSRKSANSHYLFEELEQRQLLCVTTGWEEQSLLHCYESPALEGAFGPVAAIPQSTLQGLLNRSGLTLTENDILNLNSNPGAKSTIYLDFDGHTTSGTAWNTNSTGGADFITPRYALDGNTTKTAFSTAELWAIYEIWLRVAEDFASWDVNVTTKDPGAAALTYSGTGDNAWGKRVCIGGNSYDWCRTPTEGAIGGIAWLNSFYNNSSFNGVDTPCYAFTENLGGGNAKSVAECVTHEVGHTLGLNHDGNSLIVGQEEYYNGANGWAAIMGAGYYQPLTQWSKGEYNGATNGEDDLQIISTRNGFTYKSDDYGNTIQTATKLNPQRGIIADGLIGTTGDIDMFSINTSGKDLQITIAGIVEVTNLDVGVTVYDRDGKVVATYAPGNALSVTFNMIGLVGQHYISVTGTGNGTYYSNYASLGAYTIEILNDYIDETVILVTTENDVVSTSDGLVSLREAITMATTVEGATILFDSKLAGRTILLTRELVVNHSVIIDATSLYNQTAGTPGITVSGAGKYRLFNITAATKIDVTIIGLGLTQGYVTATSYGGAISIIGTTAATLNLNLKDCLFDNNTNAQRGGGVYAQYTNVSIVSSVFTGNRATNGGAVYVVSGSLAIVNAQFNSNIATSQGGAIYSVVGVTLSGSFFDKNNAGSGGGVYLATTTVTSSIVDSSFTNNTATSGSGVYTVSVLGITHSQFINNVGIALSSTYSLKLTDSSFIDNTGNFAGAVNASGELLDIEGCSFDGNISSGSGGAISSTATNTRIAGYYKITNGVTELVKTTFSQNKAGSNGGALSVSGNLLLTDTEMLYNTSLFGGAIYVASSTGVTIDRAMFKGNSANGNGGAIYFGTSAVSPQFTLSNASFSENKAGSGGAIFAWDPLSISDCDFVYNIATSGSGGALELNNAFSAPPTLIVNCNFTSNTAYSNGGAIRSPSGLQIRFSSITMNTALTGDGGGISISGDTTVSGGLVIPTEITFSEISSNISKKGSGGGIRTVSPLTIIDSILNYNEAGNSGGALSTWDDLTVNRTTFDGNNALGTFGHGGAIQTVFGNVTLSNSLFANNSATQRGGALSLSKGASDKVAVTNCTIVDNQVVTADTSLAGGGGIYADCSLEINNSIIVENYTGRGNYDIEVFMPTANKITGRNNLSTYTNWVDGGGCRIYGGNPNMVFVNYNEGNYRLQISSVGVDSGNNAYVVGPEDLVGFSRIVNNVVDMGAYEFSTQAGIQLSTPSFTVVGNDDNTATITWTAVNNAVGYTLRYQLLTGNTLTWFTKTFTQAGTYTIHVEAPGVYEFNLKANGRGLYSDSEWGRATCTIGGNLVLDVPIEFSAIATDVDKVTLVWDPVKYATLYQVQYSTSSRFTPSTTVTLVFSTADSYLISGLNPNTTYFFHVRALGDDVSFFTSAWTTTELATTFTTPLVPGVGVATATGADRISVHLTPVANAVSYTVEYSLTADFASSLTKVGTEIDFLVTGLNKGTDYFFRYKANSAGGGVSVNWSQVFSATTLYLLADPVITNGVATDTTKIHLDWTAITAGSVIPTYYLVEYREYNVLNNPNSNWISLTVAATEYSNNYFDVTGLVANKKYDFRVKAFTIDPEVTASNYSAIVSVTTPVTPSTATITFVGGYVAPDAAIGTHVATFTNSALIDYALIPDGQDSYYFEIYKDSDGLFKLRTTELLPNGLTTVTLSIRAKAGAAWGNTQLLTVTIYRPEVTTNLAEVYTANDWRFELLGTRTDTIATTLTYKWEYTNSLGNVITQEGAYFTKKGGDLLYTPNAKGVQTSVVKLWAVDQYGITSNELFVSVYNDSAALVDGGAEAFGPVGVCVLNLSIDGTRIQNWRIDWGDNSETIVDARSTSMTFVHYYRIVVATYTIKYTLLTVSGVEKVNEIQFSVTDTPAPGALPIVAESLLPTDTAATESVATFSGNAVESLFVQETVPAETLIDTTILTRSSRMTVPMAPRFNVMLPGNYFTSSRFGRGTGQVILAEALPREAFAASRGSKAWSTETESTKRVVKLQAAIDSFFESDFSLEEELVF